MYPRLSHGAGRCRQRILRLASAESNPADRFAARAVTAVRIAALLAVLAIVAVVLS